MFLAQMDPEQSSSGGMADWVTGSVCLDYQFGQHRPAIH
jgi:hypothetical protein